MCLFLLHSRIIVDEDERSVVFGIRVALSTLVAGTEVTLLRLSVGYPTLVIVRFDAPTHRSRVIRS
jgi:hypothetical protein